MRNESHTPAGPDKAHRVQRTAAAVIAQYIQDLTHSHEPAPCAQAA